MRKFFRRVSATGLIQFAIGFTLLGLIIGSYERMKYYILILDSILVVFNIGLGVYFFTRFYESREQLIESLQRARDTYFESLRRRRNNPENQRVEQPPPPPVPEKEIKRTFSHYRKLFLGE